MNNIGDLIDATILDFIEYVKIRTFSEAVTLVKMLEMEQVRIHRLRERLSIRFNHALDCEEAQELKDQFIQTFIEEHKIKDRIQITYKYVELKGVI